MSVTGKASEAPLLPLESYGDTASSPVTDSPEATNIEVKTLDDADGNKSSDKLPEGANVPYKARSSPVDTLGAEKKEHVNVDVAEYHGHESPIVAKRERKNRKPSKSSRKGSRTRTMSSRKSDASTQPTEPDRKKSLQERASKDISVDLVTLPSTIGATDSTIDAAVCKETIALHASMSGSEQLTDFTTGDEPDSLGGFNRPRRNMVLNDSAASPEKVTGRSTQPSRPRLADIKDIVTSSFLPHSAGISESYRMNFNGLPDSAVHGAASPRNRRFDSALIVCALTVAILMAILLLVVVILAVQVDDCDRRLQLAREPVVDSICFNAACEMVVALLNKWQNPNVRPCSTFHRHVCGRWRGVGVERPSYATENRNNFLDRVGQSLERVANNTRPANSSTHQMAIFYASCSRFTVEQRDVSIRDALLLSGIDFRAWSVPRSFQDLFSIIVTECLRTGLTSVISVKLSERRVYVDIGNTLARFLPNQTNQLAAVIEAAVSELQFPRKQALIPALVNLDSHLHQALAGYSSPKKFQPVAIRDLPTEGLVLAWMRGLNRGLNNQTTVDRDTLVSASSLTEMRGLIGILSSVEVNLASIYSLMLPIAQIMNYSGAFGSKNHPDITDFCLRETAERFPLELVVWVAQDMETPEARSYFESMLATFGKVIRELPTRMKALPAFNVSDIAQVQRKTTFMPQQMPPRTLPPMDPNSYLRNTIALSGQVHNESLRSWVQLSRQQLTGDPAMLDGETMVIPTLQLTGDLLHAEANDPMLDYSTVGVRVLVEWAHVLLSKKPVIRSRLFEIVRNRTGGQLPIESLPEDVLRWMLFLPWALDLALVAARMRSPMSADKEAETHSRDQLFFRRFCQAGCGYAQGAMLCSYGTRYSAFFDRAFECQRENDDCPC